MSTTDLPKRPLEASQAALDSAIDQNVTDSAAAETSESTPTTTATATDDATSTSDYRTVFSDAANFNVKHPLYNSWTLWFDNPSQKGLASARGSKDSWGDDMNKVVSFDSVEEFWGLYNNVVPPSELPQKANYYLFKEGVKPAWEDPANTNGGKWSIQLPRDKTRAQIDRLWLYTMLAAIGETLEAKFPNGVPPPSSGPDEELITGVIMSARANFYRIAIWTRKAEDTDELAEKLLDIGKHFKVNVLGYDIDAKIGAGLTSDVEFQSHKESEKKKGKKTIV